MLIALVRTDPRAVSRKQEAFLSLELANSIARALSCAEAKIESHEVEVLHRHFDKGEIDVGGVSIVIIVNDHPSLRANLEERRDRIVADLYNIIHSSIHGLVWILPVSGVFAKF